MTFSLFEGAMPAIRVWYCTKLLPFLLLLGCGPSAMEQVDEAVPQWTKLGPGGGGSTFIPTFSYQTPENFMVRCDMTGSYLTDNGGTSYQQINLANGASSYAYDPHDSQVIYIGSAFLSRSADGGKSWKRIFPKTEDIRKEMYTGDHAVLRIQTTDSSLYNTAIGRISCVRVDPVNSASLYFSMGPSFFYTQNAGVRWNRIDLDYPVEYVYTNHGGLKNEVLIFTTHLLYVFNKTTASLAKHKLPDGMVPAFSFSAGMVKGKDEMIIYALHHDPKESIQEEFGHTELWVSHDKGFHWKRSEDPVITNGKGIRPSYSMVACAEFDAEQAYLICNRYEEPKGDGAVAHWYGALKTGDAGSSWGWVWKGGGGSGRYGVKDGTGVANLTDAWAEEAFGGEYIRLMDVGVYPADGSIAIITDWYRTMKTMDAGKTWREVYSVKQEDGTFISRGMDVTTNYGVHFDPFDSNHIAVSYTDIGYHHSFDGGRTWVRSVEGVPAEWRNTCYWVVFDPDVKDKVWSVWSSLHDFPRGKMTRNPTWKTYARGGVCVSMDGGKTWKPSNEGMGMDAATTSIVLDRNSKPGNRTLYASVFNKGVFKSTNDGRTWTLSNNGIEENTCAFELTLLPTGTLFLTVSPSPVHKDGKNGRAFHKGAVYRSRDGAASWTKLPIGNILFPNGVEYDPENPNRIYLSCWSDIMLSDLVGGEVARATGGNDTLNTDGGIFLSEDSGETWRSIFNKDEYVYDVTADPFHPGRVYAMTFNKAAYRSDDRGKTWKKLKDYDFHWGQRVIVDRNNPEKVYLTTYGSSVWHGDPMTEN